MPAASENTPVRYQINDLTVDTDSRQVTRDGRPLKVVGLMNTQFAIKGDDIYLLEVNPRASRTVPFVSKATGRPLAKIAARCMVGRTLADQGIDVILTTGSTGLTGRDVAPEALMPLFDKDIEGFGEIFRAASLPDIGASTIQSRAFAGLANATIIFCMPGSPGACKTAWEEVIRPQLDARTRPCNLVELMPRLLER